MGYSAICQKEKGYLTKIRLRTAGIDNFPKGTFPNGDSGKWHFGMTTIRQVAFGKIS